MSFPQTRLTLIRRLSSGGDDSDWSQFLDDYWGPICGFAMHWGGLSFADAEDVAAATFQAIVDQQLLERWHQQRAAKLRTLLCTVAKRCIANQARVERGRRRILAELAAQPKASLPEMIWTSAETTSEEPDAFYQAWVEDLLDRCVSGLGRYLHGTGRGDYFRVLYGHLCEQLPLAEIARLLGIPVTTAESHYKAAKRRLGDSLRNALQRHIEQYCETDVTAEFQDEWSRLSQYLRDHGGLERAVREAHRRLDRKYSGKSAIRRPRSPDVLH